MIDNPQPAAPKRARSWREGGRLRRIFYDLRTEGRGPVRDAAALGVGILIGCSPFYGFHLLLVWSVGWLLRLNRLKMYLAANISNPLFSPLLVLAEIQAGAWARRQDFHESLAGGDSHDECVGLRWRSAPGQPDRRHVARPGGRGGHLRHGRHATRRSPRRALGDGQRSLSSAQYHGVGVRAREASRRSALSRHGGRGTSAGRPARSSTSAAARA